MEAATDWIYEVRERERGVENDAEVLSLGSECAQQSRSLYIPLAHSPSTELGKFR